jgi:hypothetical protein
MTEPPDPSIQEEGEAPVETEGEERETEADPMDTGIETEAETEIGEREGEVNPMDADTEAEAENTADTEAESVADTVESIEYKSIESMPGAELDPEARTDPEYNYEHEPRPRSELFEEHRVAHEHDEPRATSIYDEPRSSSEYNKPRPTDGYDEPRPESGYDDPRSVSGYDEPRSMTAYHEARSGTTYEEARSGTAYEEARSETAYEEARSTAAYEPTRPALGYKTEYDESLPAPGYGPAPAAEYKPVPSAGYKPRPEHGQGNCNDQQSDIKIKAEPLIKQEPAPAPEPVKRGPGRPRNGERKIDPETGAPMVRTPARAVKAEATEGKETAFEIMNNLETIFKGAFLQDSEEEDAVEDENFITVQVKTKNNHKTSICFRREVLHLPIIKSIMGPRVGRPPKLRAADGLPVPPVSKKKPRIFANWLECQQCDYKCRKRQPLQSHMLEEHNEIIYLCQHCEEMFKDKNLLRDHERRVHGGVKFPCPEFECSYASSIVEELEQHVRGHPAFVEACSTCDHKADNFSQLNEHIEKEHPGDELHCEHCTATATSSEGLKEHMALNHPKPSQTSCSKCDFATKITKLQKCHEDTFHKTVEYKCSQCNFICNWESSLQSHYVKCHGGAKEFECEYCEFTCRWKTGFNKHMREKHTETGKLSTQCSHCGIQFTCRRDLKRHVKENHEKPIEFNCSYCGKNFPKKPNLKIHERIHTGEKPYKCETCGHAFTAASNLYHHKKKHLKEASHPKPKQEPKAAASSAVHTVYEQNYLPSGQNTAYRHDSTDSTLEHGGGHMEPKMEAPAHHQDSPHSKGDSGAYPEPQYLAAFPQYYGGAGAAYTNPASYSYPSPGDQYARPASGGGAAAAASEEGGAATGNYRRIFTEEQYRMLAQVG